MLKDMLKMLGGGILISLAGNIFRSTDLKGPVEVATGGVIFFLISAGAGVYLLYSGLRGYKKNRLE